MATSLAVQGSAQSASVPQTGSVYLYFQTPRCHNVLWYVVLFDLPEGHQIMGESVCGLGMR